MTTVETAQIAEKLSKLRKEYLNPQEQKDISKTEEALRRNIKRTKLAERVEVQEIIEESVKSIKDINFLLSNDESLEERERRDLFAERRVHKFWLSRFDGERAQMAIMMIGKDVDKVS